MVKGAKVPPGAKNQSPNYRFERQERQTKPPPLLRLGPSREPGLAFPSSAWLKIHLMLG